ncbi:MAG: DUF4055 domain-containing protein [Rickettsiales bacterium]
MNTVAGNLGVQTQHPEYTRRVDSWNKVDEVINGDVKKFLRDVGANERNTQRKEKRNKDYSDGAVFYNFTLHTRNGMQGAIFRRPPDVDLEDALKYLADNVDGNGTPLHQQSKAAVDQDIRKGRLGLLADMPKNDGDKVLSRAEAFSDQWLPRIQMYLAQDIINWRTTRVGSVVKLSMIVLREMYEETVDEHGFYTEKYFQYRVLGLDDDGYYYQEVWRPQAAGLHSTYNSDERFHPKQGGKKMTHIPFFFIGSEYNDYRVDTVPLEPIADLNIGHYRNSADTEENSFMASSAMLIMNPDGLDRKKFREDNPDGVQAGSRRAILIKDAKYIQAGESDKALRLMQVKEEQAQKIGAQMIDGGAQVTAETARIQNAANTSVLATIAENVSAAYTSVLADIAAFLGVSNGDDGEVKNKLSLCMDFFMTTLSAQDRAQWVAEITAGVMPASEYYAALRRSGQIHKSNEDLEREISEQDPALDLQSGLYDNSQSNGGDNGDESNAD